MKQDTYDLLVIGAGAAGSNAASTAHEMGKRVALIERDALGGTCLNYGCDPTKTLLYVASLLHQSQQVQRYGLNITSPSFDWQGVRAYVRDVKKHIRGGTEEDGEKKLREQGIALFKGEASFVSLDEIAVDEQVLKADQIIVTAGSQTAPPSIPGLSETGYITNKEAVDLDTLPKTLAIIGGGPIGIEFAQLFQRFGVQVTVLEKSAKPLDKDDGELAKQLCDLLTQEGVLIKTGVELQQVTQTKSGKHISFTDQVGHADKLVVDEILVAIAGKPALDELQLENAGVTVDKGIKVDKYLRTNIGHIWAAGDVLGTYQFTHVAAVQGQLAAQNAFAQQPQPYAPGVIPWVTYTNPPLAHAGKTEEELQAEKTEYRLYRADYKGIERAITSGETQGLVKVLTDTNGQIVGVHILGARADDILAPFILAMDTKQTLKTLGTLTLPYPTISEVVRFIGQQA